MVHTGPGACAPVALAPHVQQRACMCQPAGASRMERCP
eukprot:CAMPEP_0119511304 /NCGR_PEP_ID=MMETSP1344-20130328/29999_1 /TAXON_ID=236787 /ORGANISM="Florenciella parvula, Strain CCMP2471" /LENGTH=37 /DNA_ID= /DNA_START= /DNA_END= /DNA_ORIENTATION=